MCSWNHERQYKFHKECPFVLQFVHRETFGLGEAHTNMTRQNTDMGDKLIIEIGFSGDDFRSFMQSGVCFVSIHRVIFQLCYREELVCGRKCVCPQFVCSAVRHHSAAASTVAYHCSLGRGA